MRSPIVTNIEIAYRRQPENETLQAELVATLMQVMGYTVQEAAVYAQLTQLLGRREQRQLQAHELLKFENPNRPLMIQQIIGVVGDLDAETAAFEIVVGTFAPEIVNKELIAKDKTRRTHVRVGADWLIAQLEGMSSAEKTKKKHAKKRETTSD